MSKKVNLNYIKSREKKGKKINDTTDKMEFFKVGELLNCFPNIT